MTERLKRQLSLPVRSVDTLMIKTFGSNEERIQTCDVVDLLLKTREGKNVQLTFLAVPFICDPLARQPLSHAMEIFPYLSELELADTGGEADIDVLVGSDLYWSLVTGRIIRGENGPTAIETVFGWVLSGPVDSAPEAFVLTSTHTLRVESSLLLANHKIDTPLDSQLQKFWDLEVLGIQDHETSVYDEFVKKISFKDGRYEVHLPWKEQHPPLGDHYQMSLNRLISLLQRLKRSPEVLKEYDTVIKNQLSSGIIEIASKPNPSSQVHYLPHHPVIRSDRDTTKFRIVYDASAKTTGTSLNDCLYVGPPFGQYIFDIILRFRVHNVALAGDIEKAFSMISIAEEDRDALRFLWVNDPFKKFPEIILRFKRVIFGVSASPFLLNATIEHHISKYRSADPQFVSQFLRSIYVDDVTYGSSDVNKTYDLYCWSKKKLAEGGFHLRKFVTNSTVLRSLINEQEMLQPKHSTEPEKNCHSLCGG